MKTISKIFLITRLEILLPVTKIPPKDNWTCGFFKTATVKATPGKAYKAQPTNPQ